MSKPTYRADIDGLRALAVVPVVLYHLNFRLFSGGYVGVDVFFVISGYLITRLIDSEVRSDRYSIIRFYERRARRIFPALFVMCGITTLGVLLINLPSEVSSFKDSLFAATLFVSNIYFYFTQDYYGPAADTLPLLHTWSLAVEEQFYIFFPLLLMLCHLYFRSAKTKIIFSILLISFGISIWLVQDNPPAAFYLIYARAWELMIGAALAVGAIPSIDRRPVAEALGALGVLLIAFSTFFYDDSTPFPGLAALAPCLGAALVIHAGERHRTLTARVLSLGPLRITGLISYSLYLWHWPVVVGTLNLWGGLTAIPKLIALGLSVGLAVLSWRYVEQPFRRQPYVLPGRKILGASALTMVSLIALAFVANEVSPKLWNIPDSARQLLAIVPKTRASHDKTCFLSSTRNDIDQYDREACLRLSDEKPNWLVVGDSMSNDIMPALRQTYPGVNILQASSSGCRPVVEGPGEPRCLALRNFIFEDFLPAHRVDAVILAGRWRAEEADAVAATVASLAPHVGTVIVLGPRVLYRQALPRLLAMQIIKNDPGIAARARVRGQKAADELFAGKLAGTGAQYFSLYRAICPEDSPCKTTDDAGRPLQVDYGHFTSWGAAYVISQLKTSVRVISSRAGSN